MQKRSTRTRLLQKRAKTGKITKSIQGVFRFLKKRTILFTYAPGVEKGRGRVGDQLPLGEGAPGSAAAKK